MTDLQDAYNLPANGGAGQTIAIVDAYDDPNAEQDLAVYRAQFGLPACTTDSGCFSKVNQRGASDYPRPDEGWASEIALDLDMVSAAAPLAHIVLVEADSNEYADLGQAVNEAVVLGAKYVSNSYGGSEDPSEHQALDPYYNHPGVAVLASSGDDAYGTSYPAASPYVTSVGGTSLTRTDGTPRGWSETVWEGSHGGPGSGCSEDEPKPAFQTDSGCPGRTIADVSAVADPVTGVSVYTTFGGTGWSVFGGTSASAPLIAGVYADAGTPVEGTYPVSYPYAAAGSGLNDITSGSNGSCSPPYLCTAGAGYDGPTGLGTPNGLSAFRAGPHGSISGRVTDSASGAPVAGATVVIGSETGYADSDGRYRLALPVGSYDLTVNAFGYAAGKVVGVRVADGDALTENVALKKVPTRTLSGHVTDGSGHGWPLYAKITVDGVPGGDVWTDPSTGEYAVKLPQGHTYSLNVAPAYPGYQPAGASVPVGDSDTVKDIKVPVDLWAGTAPGYEYKARADSQKFSAGTTPPGWSVLNAEGSKGGWAFDDAGSLGNDTGGTGGFAAVDSHLYGPIPNVDSSLISPAYDLSKVDQPELTFRTTYRGYTLAEAEVSTDGGAQWTQVWQAVVDVTGERIDVPLTDYAHISGVQVRFHFVDTAGLSWKIDDVAVGQRYASPRPGGLVVGGVSDANTSRALVGAALQSTAGAHTASTVSDDPSRRGDFFWLFEQPGKHKVTASYRKYTPLTKTVRVDADRTTNVSFPLTAGRLQVAPASLSASVGWGKRNAKTVSVRNTGTAPATLKLGELAADNTTANSEVPLQRIKGNFSALASVPATQPVNNPAPHSAASAGDGSWKPGADTPVATGSSAVDAYGGKVYSALGITEGGMVNTAYRYDPQADSWTQLASASDQREAPAHGFINGKWYVAGGWIPGYPSNRTDAKLEIYDPAKNTWTTGASEPMPLAGAGTAVLNGKLYAVGGCTDHCGYSFVNVYDPKTDTWSQAANYPEWVAWEACGAISGKLYCAGGTAGSHELKSAYVYDPAANSWSPLPAMPAAQWGSNYAPANGQLMVSSGISSSLLVNSVTSFDPQTGEWAALPPVDQPTYRGGGATGFYRVGGFSETGHTVPTVSVLPGYGYADATDVPWLAESRTQVTLRPGQSTNITVTFNAAVPSISEAGFYRAALHLTSDTPYTTADLPVSLNVARASSQAEITGLVRGAAGRRGATVPLAGATVTIASRESRHTLETDVQGHFGIQLDIHDNPVKITVTKHGYRPATATVHIKKGTAVVSNFTLTRR
ncbi:carboxypeptidase regulatory-like domain-containing protein [Streptomyces sp. NPDC059215]|uniref:carboxypeptidase regulatory-like domain-containing protein n=1 Tax=Streptomyces sp. NPDC059215 TaxID=3346772 RepID=UPI0036B7364F